MKRSLRALLPGMLLAVPGIAWAQPALERSLICERSESEPLNALAFGQGQAARAEAAYSPAERACWADWAQAHALMQAPGSQWVDVREAGAVARLGLPGAAAVGLADLADKAFLKGQSLMLVGSGVDLKTLSDHCTALRASGQFRQVHVLLGGVRAWRLAGQPVQGTAALAPDEASAQELWLGAADDLWQVAALGLNAQQTASLPVARERLLDLGADLAQAVNTLAAQGHQNPLPAPRQWLVMADTPERLAQARALWHQRVGDKRTPAPVWLSGAWPAYASYLDHQQTLAAHAGRPLPRLCGM